MSIAAISGDPAIKPERLRKRSEFLQVAATNRKWVTPGVILQARPHSTDETCSAPVRIGFTVTRKVGNAVIRNRAKRRLRAAAADVMTGAVSGYDFVLIGRASTLTRDYGDLCRDLAAAVKGIAARS